MAGKPFSADHRTSPAVLVIFCLTVMLFPFLARAERVDRSVLQATLRASQDRVERCAAQAQACDPASVSGPQQVGNEAVALYTIHWTWLADALRSAQKVSPQQREDLMASCRQHLAVLSAQAGGEGVSAGQAAFPQARQAANAALARAEFRSVEQGPSWFDRQVARIQSFLLQAFSGLGRLGEKAPWLAPAIEWGCFALAAAGLLWFLWRSLQRQSLRISLGEGALLRSRMIRDSADWQRMSNDYAATAHWREAIHCLYWAAISLLESRRAWQPNATRTPREYLQLLRPGSSTREVLQRVTRQFEQTWYGRTEASEDQYRTALEDLRTLETAAAERVGSSMQRPGPASAASFS